MGGKLKNYLWADVKDTLSQLFCSHVETGGDTAGLLPAYSDELTMIVTLTQCRVLAAAHHLIESFQHSYKVDTALVSITLKFSSYNVFLKEI